MKICQLSINNYKCKVNYGCKYTLFFEDNGHSNFFSGKVWSEYTKCIYIVKVEPDLTKINYCAEGIGKQLSFIVSRCWPECLLVLNYGHFPCGS